MVGGQAGVLTPLALNHVEAAHISEREVVLILALPMEGNPALDQHVNLTLVTQPHVRPRPLQPPPQQQQRHQHRLHKKVCTEITLWIRSFTVS